MVFVCISVCMTKKYLLESIKKDTLSGYAVAGCFNQRHKQQQIDQNTFSITSCGRFYFTKKVTTVSSLPQALCDVALPPLECRLSPVT